MLLSLIGSIHQVDFENLDEIAVFDIGFTQEQKKLLEKIEKTKVYKTEEVNADIFKVLLLLPVINGVVEGSQNDATAAFPEVVVVIALLSLE